MIREAAAMVGLHLPPFPLPKNNPDPTMLLFMQLVTKNRLCQSNKTCKCFKIMKILAIFEQRLIHKLISKYWRPL